jgi:hypothetical protein
MPEMISYEEYAEKMSSPIDHLKLIGEIRNFIRQSNFEEVRKLWYSNKFMVGIHHPFEVTIGCLVSDPPPKQYLSRVVHEMSAILKLLVTLNQDIKGYVLPSWMNIGHEQKFPKMCYKKLDIFIQHSICTIIKKSLKIIDSQGNKKDRVEVVYEPGSIHDNQCTIYKVHILLEDSKEINYFTRFKKHLVLEFYRELCNGNIFYYRKKWVRWNVYSSAYLLSYALIKGEQYFIKL